MTLPLRLALAALLASSVACGGGNSNQAAPAANTGKPVDAATAGAISGTVTFEGTPPAPQPIRLSRDCIAGGTPNPVSDAVLVGANGALKNAFIYVKDGLDPGYTFDTPAEPVELAQKGCEYAPRVFGIRVGQTLDVVNADATLHNVHALPMVNEEFNKSQPLQNSHMKHVFTAPEVMVRFKCDVHAWMAAYVGVLPHPYFAVSDEAGHFDIRNLPPGHYTIEAWHETFGRRTANVTVGEKQQQTVTFTFAAAAK
jgi:plastocyanin